MKKQITIDGKSSDWFETAIFVLKEPSNVPIPNNLFDYAEQLIENHLKRTAVVSQVAAYKQQMAIGQTRKDTPVINQEPKNRVLRKQQIIRRGRIKLIEVVLYILMICCLLGAAYLFMKMMI